MVILRWLGHIFSRDIIHILAGNWNRLLGRENGLYAARYGICRACDRRETVRGVGEICGICGCPLKSKLRVRDEHCDLNKWNDA